MPVILGLMALVLALLGLHYARRQVQFLRRLPAQRDELSTEDYRYERNQAWRRLAGCALLLGMAGMLVVYLATDLEGQKDQQIAQRNAERQARPADAPPDELPPGVRIWIAFWASFLALLGMLVLLVAWDVWAIRRYALRHLRQINADRRAMIEQELAILRSRRNGQVRPTSHAPDSPDGN